MQLGYATGALVTNSNLVTNRVRTIGATVFNEADIFGGPLDVNGIRDPISPGDVVVAIFALEGTTALGPGPAQWTATFTTGKAQYVSIPYQSFNPDDPTTWGWGNPILGEFWLKLPEPVIPGPHGDQIVPIPASDVNVSAVNLAIGSLGSGIFLGEQTDIYDDPPYQRPFLTDFDDYGWEGQVVGEGMLFSTGQSIVQPDMATVDSNGDGTPDTPGALQQATLDAIAGWGFADVFASWALALNHPDNWDIVPAPGATGDFQADVDMFSDPIIQVPLPAALWMALPVVGILGVVRAVRRRRAL